MFKKDAEPSLRKVRVVLVEPEYQINVGMAARALKNFGCRDLALVRPRAKPGFTTKMFAKHAENVLAEAKTFKSLREAVKGCGVVVGTTAATERFAHRLKNCVSARELPKKIRGRGRVALVFGSEATGLREEDICACDLVATIPSAAEQPVLNLSHAVAVLLYELYSSQAGENLFFETAAAHKLKRLEQMFAEALAEANRAPDGRRVHDERKVATAFRRALERSEIADDEAQALFAGLSKIISACRKR